MFEAQFVDADSIGVKYDYNDGTTGSGSTTKVYQEKVTDTTVTFTLAEAPTREGYTFLGWKCNLDGDSTTYYEAGKEVTYALTNSEITFTAQWGETQVTINLTYDTDGGTITSTDYTKTLTAWELDSSATITTLPEVEKEGYFFTGWTCGTEGVSYDAETGILTWEESAKTVTKITLKANYEKIEELTVTYDANDEGVTTATQVVYTQGTAGQTNVTFNLAETPTREGYTFLGWKCNLDGDSTTYYKAGKEVTYALTNSEITFTAQWEETECTINLN